MNYIGQLRLYSLVDLVLLLIAARLTTPQLAGALFLWIGFLLYLENGHRHSNRALFPPYCWAVFWLAGALLFPPLHATAFIFLSILYTKKKQGNWGLAAPAVRGLQAYMLVAAVPGWDAQLALFAGVLTVMRNVMGDVRDIKKDSEEGMKTWPMILRLPELVFPIHLLGVIATTVIWWHVAGLPPVTLLAAIFIEVATYKWTPR